MREGISHVYSLMGLQSKYSCGFDTATLDAAAATIPLVMRNAKRDGNLDTRDDITLLFLNSSAVISCLYCDD